ncbi:hypothetical protein TSUD_151370 [Trifolium subterraneum]|uniref:Fringe-like glycosyltransferase domain-containing protein n=1 Tax=Trifolium subterraneum TaxID=3900 RepID=A0A2Z6NIW6_TRISU|nr:hypothetical protein TSUD_151370 [Trifolium subterraneum]
MVSISIRVGLLICLIASITLAFHSTFAKPDRRFPLPEHLHVIQNVSVIQIDNEPTNISHIVFGIAGSSNTWHSRSNYSKLWWNPDTCRGFAWLDKRPGDFKSDHMIIPYKISKGWTRFRHVHSASAVRIARIVYESFRLGLPNVRWFVMGDDDTVFFPENLVTVLGKYDHNQLYYIGGNSESVEQDLMHCFDMAFGGGGIAISYALAVRLAQIMDSSAHPLAPLVSLHHLDQLDSLFPDQSQMHSLRKLISAYHLDPARIVQQSVCYDHRRKWSISISWGYTIQIYTSLVIIADLQMPFQTFKTWRSSSDGPFTFNTRWLNPDECQQPSIFFLDQVRKVGSGSVTTYKRYYGKEGKNCKRADGEVQRIKVSVLKLDSEYWQNVPRRQCCQIMNGGSIKDGNVHIRIRKCRAQETITI